MSYPLVFLVLLYVLYKWQYVGNTYFVQLCSLFLFFADVSWFNVAGGVRI